MFPQDYKSSGAGVTLYSGKSIGEHIDD